MKFAEEPDNDFFYHWLQRYNPVRRFQEKYQTELVAEI